MGELTKEEQERIYQILNEARKIAYNDGEKPKLEGSEQIRKLEGKAAALTNALEDIKIRRELDGNK